MIWNEADNEWCAKLKLKFSMLKWKWISWLWIWLVWSKRVYVCFVYFYFILFIFSFIIFPFRKTLDDDSGEKSVSVLLNGEESEIVFIDHSTSEMSVSNFYFLFSLSFELFIEFNSISFFMFCRHIRSHFIFLKSENCLTSYEPHGFCVIYSSADRASFILAERIIQSLWTSENIAQKAVILVGNKADLARSRCVSSEGKWRNRKKKRNKQMHLICFVDLNQMEIKFSIVADTFWLIISYCFSLFRPHSKIIIYRWKGDGNSIWL